MFDFKTIGLFGASSISNLSRDQVVPESITNVGDYVANITGFSDNTEISDDGFMTSYHEPQEPLDEFMTNFTKFWSN